MPERRGHAGLYALAALAFLALGASGALGADVFWTASAGGAWSKGAHWSTGAAPDSTDDVHIELDGTYTIALDVNARIGSLEFGAAGGGQTLSIAKGRTLTLDRDSWVRGGGVLNLQDGTVAGPGALSNGSTIFLKNATLATSLRNGGTLSVWGPCVVRGELVGGPYSKVQIVGDGARAALLNVNGGFTNAGVVELTSIRGLANAGLTVVGGALTNAERGAIQTLPGTGGKREISAQIVNKGSLVLGQPLTITARSAECVNTGRIEVWKGNLTFNLSGSSLTNTGAISIGPRRTVTINGGTLNQNDGTLGGIGALALSNVRATFGTPVMVGSLGLSASTVTLAMDFSTAATALTFNRSTLNGPGTVTNAASRTLVIEAGTIAAPFVNEGVLVVRGKSTLRGSLSAPSGSRLRVESDAILGAATLSIGSIINHGTIELTSLADRTATLAVSGALVNAEDAAIVVAPGAGGARELIATLDNRGTIDVRHSLTSGRFLPEGSPPARASAVSTPARRPAPVVTNAGTITIAPSQVLVVKGGTLQNAASGLLRNQGTIDVSSGGLGNAGAIELGTPSETPQIVGPFAQTALGSLNLKAMPSAAGSASDSFDFPGAGVLEGALNLSFAEGFSPLPGDRCLTLSYGSGKAQFSSITGPPLGKGLSLAPVGSDGRLALVAVAPVWKSIFTSGRSPSPREGHSAIYDAASNRMIVFGGRCDGGASSDTWVLEGANGLDGGPVWRLLPIAGKTPPSRADHTAVYDPASNRMIVFGGDNASGSNSRPLSDVWVLTNANGTGPEPPAWHQRFPGGTEPAARAAHAAVYDRTANRLMVIGGRSMTGSIPSGLGDVWALSNANGVESSASAWVALAPTGTGPSPRFGHGAVYDDASGRVTLFGGTTPSAVASNEVWVLAGANDPMGKLEWIQLRSASAPGAPRTAQSAVHDPTRNVVTLFGGKTATGPSSAASLYPNASGSTGSGPEMGLASEDLVPPARFSHAAVYDAAHRRMIVFGGHSGSGRLNDLWVLDAGENKVVTPAATLSALKSMAGFARRPTPNPSRGEVALSIVLAREQTVELSVYDIAGRCVEVLHHGKLRAGEHAFRWRGTRRGAPAAAGIYLALLRGEGFNETRRFTVIR